MIVIVIMIVIERKEVVEWGEGTSAFAEGLRRDLEDTEGERRTGSRPVPLNRYNSSHSYLEADPDSSSDMILSPNWANWFPNLMRILNGCILGWEVLLGPF